MGRRFFRGLGLALLCMLLIGSTVLVACSDGEGDNEVLIGILTDFTGPAAFATTPTYESFRHAVRWSLEQDPIPGLEVKYLTYDQRTDPARVSPGYMWLQGRGVDMMYIMSPTDNAILAEDVIRDQMPVLGNAIAEEIGDNPNIFNFWGSDGHTTEGAAMWIMENWDYEGEGRPPKLAHFSWTHPTGGFHQAGFARMLDWYPDKFEWLGVEAPPIGSTGFSAEISRIRNADFIFITPVGAMMASFMREARDRGYTGAFVSGTNQFPGYWPLVQGAVAADKLYECYFLYYTPWWTDDVPFIQEAKEAIEKYSRNPEVIYTGGGPSGWSCGLIAINAIRIAAENVGIENIDRMALLDAFASVELDLEGFGNVWKITEDDEWNVFCRTVKAYKWDLETLKWMDAGTEWSTPPSLARD